MHGRQPNGEVARIVFDENPYKPLEGAEHRAVQHHRHLPTAVLCNVLRIQSTRHRKIDLNGSALPHSTQTIFQRKLDFWAVEGTLARQHLPTKSFKVEGICQGFFCPIPNLIVAGAHQEDAEAGALYVFMTADGGARLDPEDLRELFMLHCPAYVFGNFARIESHILPEVPLEKWATLESKEDVFAGPWNARCYSVMIANALSYWYHKGADHPGAVVKRWAARHRLVIE